MNELAIAASSRLVPSDHSMYSGRMVELDSLRGIAAALVVVGHICNLFPNVGSFKLTPFYNAHASVILFFILSGLVLSPPFLKPKSVIISSFYIRRIVRIYVPYIAAVIVAMLLCLLLSTHGILGYTGWFNNYWQSPPNARNLAEHLLLIDSFDNASYDPVIWSLVHEMRISLLFPLLMIAVIRFRPVQLLFLSAGFSMGAAMLCHIAIDHYNFNFDYFQTIHYAALFIIGATTYKYIAAIRSKMHKFNATTRWLTVLAGIILFTYPKFLETKLDCTTSNLFFNHFTSEFLIDWTIALGCVTLIISVLTFEGLSQAITNRFLQFIGRISYSLYLYHAPVLFALIYLLHDRLPLITILIISIPVIFLIAFLTYQYIERPCVSLARRLSQFGVAAS